jgi:hypothetical protein
MVNEKLRVGQHNGRLIDLKQGPSGPSQEGRPMRVERGETPLRTAAQFATVYFAKGALR